MRDEKKIVWVRLESAEPDPATETFSASMSLGSVSAAAVSRHTASCFQRSARTSRRPVTARPQAEAVRASAPAPFAVSVRFQFVVIVLSPAVSRGCSVCFFGSVFGFRSHFSEPLARLFDRVQVSENHVRFELAFRCRTYGLRPAFSVRFRPARPAPAKLRSSSDGRDFRRPFFRFTTPVRPPVPLVCCSLRSWFVSFFGSICCSVQFSSVQFSSSCFVLFCPSCSTLLVSVRFSVSSIRFVLSSSYALCPLTGVLFILFSRILYTISREIQMYFLSESMSFLRIVQIIDVKAKKFDALEYSTRPSRKPAKTIKEQAIFIPRIDRQQKTARKTIRFPVDNKKNTCSVTMLRQTSEETEEFGLFPTRIDTNKFRPNKLVFLYCFQSLFSCFQRKRI